MATENQVRANRLNARKSTGPRTDEGKTRVRRNALKHGLSGQGVALPPADQEALDARLGLWKGELRAEGDLEAGLVRQAALAMTRLDRIAADEAWGRHDRARKAVKALRQEGGEDVEGTAAGLDGEPAETVRGLRKTAAGCDWLRKRWPSLAASLAANGVWSDGELARALKLSGRDPASAFPDETADRLNRAAKDLRLAAVERDRIEQRITAEDVELDSRLEPRVPAWMRSGALFDLAERKGWNFIDKDYPPALTVSDARRGEARGALEAFAAGEVSRLERRRERLSARLPRDRDSAARRAAREAASAVPTATGLRFESSSVSQLHRALDQLRKCRKDRADGVKGGDATPPAPPPSPAETFPTRGRTPLGAGAGLADPGHAPSGGAPFPTAPAVTGPRPREEWGATLEQNKANFPTSAGTETGPEREETPCRKLGQYLDVTAAVPVPPAVESAPEAPASPVENKANPDAPRGERTEPKGTPRTPNLTQSTCFGTLSTTDNEPPDVPAGTPGGGLEPSGGPPPPPAVMEPPRPAPAPAVHFPAVVAPPGSDGPHDIYNRLRRALIGLWHALALPRLLAARLLRRPRPALAVAAALAMALAAAGVAPGVPGGREAQASRGGDALGVAEETGRGGLNGPGRSGITVRSEGRPTPPRPSCRGSRMAHRFRVLITDFLDETSVEDPVLGDVADITLAGASDERDLTDLAADADAMIVYHDVPAITDATFSRATKCRGVVRAGVGFNNVDIAATGRRGIVVCNVPDYGTEEVADHAIMMLLAVVRRLIPSHDAIRAGGWDYRTAVDAPRLRGKTLGLVGCGRIGSATALRAKALGLDVVLFDPLQPDGVDKALGIRRARSLDELMSQSLFVSLHCYLDESTFHMIDAKALALMPRGGVLVNTARGPVVDQKALVDALDSGRLLGAALNVVEREPLDDDRLRLHPRVILTPHSAFFSVEGFVELRQKTAAEVRRILLGEPPRNPVNRHLLVNPRTAVGS